MATLAARQPRGDWRLLTACPTRLVTTPSSDVTGAAEAKCVFWRPCVYWFKCNEKFFPVTGRQFLTTDPGPGTTLPVLVAAVPLPFKGMLGQVASSLGVSITLGAWFTPQGQATAETFCSTIPGADQKPEAEEYEKPTCERNGARLGNHLWPTRVLLDELPTDAEEVEDD